MMQTLFRKFCLILFCSLFLFGCSPSEKTILHDSDGNKIEIASLKNKWIILNYWASWCHTCAIEIPELNDFYQHNTDENIVIYGINVDPVSGDDLKQAVQALGIKFPVLADAPNSFEKLASDVSAVPTTYIISPQGEVVKTIVGATTKKELIDYLNTLRK